MNTLRQIVRNSRPSALVVVLAEFPERSLDGQCEARIVRPEAYRLIFDGMELPDLVRKDERHLLLPQHHQEINASDRQNKDSDR